MKCKHCGFECAENQKFCTGCGTPLDKVKIRTCSKCGQIIQENDKFCTSCGEPVQTPVVSGAKTSIAASTPGAIPSIPLQQKKNSNNVLVIVLVAILVVLLLLGGGSYMAYKYIAQRMGFEPSITTTHHTNSSGDTSGIIQDNSKADDIDTPPPVPVKSPQEIATENAGKAFREFHKDLSMKNFWGAYNMYSANMKNTQGAYEQWKQGYKTTEESSVVKLSPAEQSLTRVVFNYRLRAVDATESGPLTRHFAGKVTMIKVGENWYINDVTGRLDD